VRAPQTALAAAFSAAGEAAPDAQAAFLAPSLFPGGDNRLEFEPSVSLFAAGEGNPPAAIACDTSFDCGAGDAHHGESDWSPEG
jgi:hypothetical protein